jgi:hypothetical protein
MKKTVLILSVIVVVTTIMIIRCTSPIVAGDTVVIPQSFPDESITGITFPTDSNTINKWINDEKFTTRYDSASIYKHAWGIWAGLTAPTDQKDGAGTKLLVYETWMGLNEVRDYIESGLSCNTGESKRKGRAGLTKPKQFEHAGMLARSINKMPKLKNGDIAEANNLWVTVSYNRDQACHAINNKLFKQSVINTYYNADAIGNIPSFPNTSIMIKPTYLEFPASAKILQMPVWLNAPNPPDSLNVFAPDQFPLCVYVDVQNKQASDKKLVPVTTGCKDKDSINKATCNLNDFINFTVDSTMAAFMNQQDSIQGVQATPGNRVLLVAMHVSTKEISNWTWQTYYWTPTPSTPGSPSSSLAASLMPTQVKGAARHYAVNAAYVMTTPNNSSAKDAGSMFGYNPYLEGGFGPSTFNLPNENNPQFVYGMQTNCMSCHAMATPPSGSYSTTGYNTDQFVDLNSSKFFKGQVKLDFAWSIQTALINDTIPYWLRK